MTLVARVLVLTHIQESGRQTFDKWLCYLSTVFLASHFRLCWLSSTLHWRRALCPHSLPSHSQHLTNYLHPLLTWPEASIKTSDRAFAVAAATTWNCQNSDHHPTVHSSYKNTPFHTWLITYHSSVASDSLPADELWLRYTNLPLIDW